MLNTLDPKVMVLGGVRVGQLRTKSRDCSPDARSWGWFDTNSLGGIFCNGNDRGHFAKATESKESFGLGEQFTWIGWNNTDTSSEREKYFSSDYSRNNYW
jgi:hypothetical protein